jgi:hypothetical protein
MRYMMRKLLLILTAALLLGAASTAAMAGQAQGPAPEETTRLVKNAPEGTGFEGRVVWEGQVTAGAHVYAYSSFDDLLAHKPFAVSAPSADDGTYKLDLPAGKYYLVAKKFPSEQDDGPMPVGGYYTFHGSNPITVVPGTYTHVGFSLVKKEAEPVYEDSSDPGSGTLIGTVTYMGKPLDGVYVSLFLDSSTDFRGMGYSTTPPTGKNGMFRVDFLPESDYYVVARKRANGSGSGPLNDGDSFGYFIDNPVSVKAGKIVRIKVEVLNKAGEIGKDDSLFRATGTQITGRITDKDGKVVKGVYAFAYVEKVMAHKRPEFISRQVDDDGRYVINLSQGGTYYIGARSKYGDSPALGEWYGRYDKTADHSVVVDTNKRVDGVDIVVEQILP